MVDMASTMPTPTRRVTRQSAPVVQMRKAGPYVHAADRRRDAVCTRLTLRLSGVNEKQVARATERNRSTVNRWVNGAVDTPETHFRRYLRKLVSAGTFPVAMLADAAAETWAAAMRGWSLEEMDERRRELHRAETIAGQRVDLWQLDDIEGLAPECEDAVDEAILEQATRLIELYALRCERRLHVRGEA